MSDDEPRKIVILGLDASLGRELAQQILKDARLRGRVEIVDKFPEDPRPALEPLDLEGALERIRAERSEYLAPATPNRRRDHNEVQPYHGSKHDRRRKWWNR